MSTGIRRSTRNLAIGCTGALAVAVCGVAGAAQADANTTSVWKDGNTLRVSADYNVQNEILVARNAAYFFVTDFLDTVSPGAGCTAVVPPDPNMVPLLGSRDHPRPRRNQKPRRHGRRQSGGHIRDDQGRLGCRHPHGQLVRRPDRGR